MPYIIRPIRHTRLFKVINRTTGDVKAKRTTLGKAQAQVRLLESIDNR